MDAAITQRAAVHGHLQNVWHGMRRGGARNPLTTGPAEVNAPPDMQSDLIPELSRQPRPPLLVASHLAPSVLPLYRLVADRIGDRLERPVEFVVADSYERCARDLDHVCFVCSIPYLLLARSRRTRMQVLAAPVLTGTRHESRPIYFSDVIVPGLSDVRTFGDLTGRRFAYNEPYSHSGYLVVLHALATRGLTTDFFGEMVEVGFHQIAIQMVAEGRVDGAAIDSQVLALALRDDPGLADRIRVVDVLGPSTIQPVVASVDRLTQRDRDSISDVVVSLADDDDAAAVLDAAGISRFVRANARAYTDIATMFDRVARSNLLPAWWWPRWQAIVGYTSDAQATVGEQAFDRGNADGTARGLHARRGRTHMPEKRNQP